MRLPNQAFPGNLNLNLNLNLGPCLACLSTARFPQATLPFTFCPVCNLLLLPFLRSLLTFQLLHLNPPDRNYFSDYP